MEPTNRERSSFPTSLVPRAIYAERYTDDITVKDRRKMVNKYSVPAGYKRKKYRKDFLKKVLCRADFDTPLKIEEGGPPDDLYKVVKLRFPIPEIQNLIGKELTIGPGIPKEKEFHKKEWFYHGKDREKYLKVTPEFLVIEYTKYDYFEKMEEDFLSSIDALYKSFPNMKLKRLGIRYIDSIELESEPDPTDWKKYFSDEITKNIDIATDKSTLARAFSVIEFNYGDAFLKFQYGIFNSDYPATIKKKAFVLDYDMFTNQIVEQNEIKDILNQFHVKLGSCFEEVIKDELRNKMEPIDE